MAESSNIESNVSNETENQSSSKSSATPATSEKDDCSEYDIGRWLEKSSRMTPAQKKAMLNSCWVPPNSYNFREDSTDPKRSFIRSWIQLYTPWLAYSKKLRGALCLHCVLFPPTVVQGVLGAFIVTPFTRYKNMHDACRGHASSQWHKQSTKAAKCFLENVPVDVMMVSGHDKLIAENRKIITSIISTILFCGTHDLPLRGKESHSGKII